MQQALRYYLYVFANSNAMNGISPDTTVVRVATWWEKALKGTDVALGVLSALTLVGYAVSAAKQKKSK